MHSIIKIYFLNQELDLGLEEWHRLDRNFSALSFAWSVHSDFICYGSDSHRLSQDIENRWRGPKLFGDSTGETRGRKERRGNQYSRPCLHAWHRVRLCVTWGDKVFTCGNMSSSCEAGRAEGHTSGINHEHVRGQAGMNHCHLGEMKKLSGQSCGFKVELKLLLKYFQERQEWAWESCAAHGSFAFRRSKAKHFPSPLQES